MSEKDTITIKGARMHNLKGVDLKLPKNKIIAMTGVSGSGKSSLAFDTIFAEGQRRYIESLSPYARQFLGEMKKPEVDEISGLSPAIAINQKAMSSNPRSNVATLTEIYDYLRVLYARIGKPYCLKCGDEIKKLSTDEMINIIKQNFKETKAKRMIITSPVVLGRKGDYYQLLYDHLNKGFDEARIDGEFADLHEKIRLERYKNHTIEIVVDKLDMLEQTRLFESVEMAIELSEGLVNVLYYSDKHYGNLKKESMLSTSRTCPKDGFSFPEIEPRLFSFNSPYGACPTCEGLGTIHKWSSEPCPNCQGKRLSQEALSVKIEGKNIDEITQMTIKNAHQFFNKLSNKLENSQFEIAYNLLEEIISRLNFLEEVGLSYLTLNRKAGTLAGGEAQRIRLASQMGSRLSGALYILDEPTIGLHARDTNRLMDTLKNIRDLGNTVIVVEHDPNVIKQSDYLVDLGPGPGKQGGEVVSGGEVKKLLKSKKKTLTLNYLRGEKKIKTDKVRTKIKNKLTLKGATANNLNDLFNTIVKNLPKYLKANPGNKPKLKDLAEIKGSDKLTNMVEINQSPIGRSSRSNPATYSGAFTPIRDLFANLEASRERGYSKSRFSFNVDAGRCQACDGAGYKEVELHFLPSVEVECEICKGQRFNKETLEIKYQGKNIAQVLAMTIDEAYQFFKDIPNISEKLLMLKEVGLGYLELGQSATTLSGGEAQRLKLARELTKNSRGALYLLDEPTVGLHYYDVEMLLEVLQSLVDRGNSVMVIEHNLDIIKNADWVIDLGPGGGESGGQVVVEGQPKEIAKYTDESETAKYLKKELND
jgi:excinuclease ABC subunit A